MSVYLCASDSLYTFLSLLYCDPLYLRNVLNTKSDDSNIHNLHVFQNIIILLLFFTFPIVYYTLYFGGIEINIRMCSCLYYLYLFIHSRLFLFTCASLLIFPYIIFLRCLGVNTVSYLQIHFLCAKLSLSSFIA